MLATSCPIKSITIGKNQSHFLQSSQSTMEKSSSVLIITSINSLMIFDQEDLHQVSLQKKVLDSSVPFYLQLIFSFV